ncbi:MAG: carbonate dehydratase [Balneolales bacterium]
MDAFYNSLLDNNKKWVAKKIGEDPNFFNNLKEQHPPLLWIGCADSRVPANEITGTQPGEVFVHRNIANMVVHSDMNLLSILDYGVNILKVKHIIVCGHYGCGGVLAAMSNKQYGLIDNWLRHIKDVYRIHQDELNAIKDQKERGNRFTELNIVEQVDNLSKSSIIQNAWEKGQQLAIHGWVYDIANGIIVDLDVSVKDNSELESYFKFDDQGK